MKTALFIVGSLLACWFTPPVQEVPDFSLRSVDNRLVSLASYPEAKGFMVVFTCNHCPFAKLYAQRLNDLHTKYAALGVPLLAVNSMDTLVYEEETFAGMQVYANQYNFNFPYLQDAQQTVGKAFNAAHTPQSFVVWKEMGRWVIKYSGSIDDNGEEPEKARPLIATAVDELLAGKPVSAPETESFGCRIFYRK